MLSGSELAHLPAGWDETNQRLADYCVHAAFVAMAYGCAVEWIHPIEVLEV